MFRLTAAGYNLGMIGDDIAEALGHLDAAGISYEIVARCPEATCAVCSNHPLADVA